MEYQMLLEETLITPKSDTKRLNCQRDKWINSTLRSIGMYPLTMIRTLIQLGYEPLPPKFGKTILGRPQLYLPNIVSYGSYIRNVDGFFGVYRGFYPYLGYEFTRTLSEYLLESYYNDYTTLEQCEQLETHVSDEKNNDEDDKLVTNDRKCYNDHILKGLVPIHCEMNNEILQCQKEIVIGLISTTLSHPLRVIATRTIAEFVGHEDLYTNILNSINEIWEHEGVAGFITGLFPALLGCACFIMGSTLVYLSSLYIAESHTHTPPKPLTRTILKFGSRLITSYSFYPLQTVSTAMMVNGSRLRIAQIENGYPFKNSLECYKFLKLNGRLYRGSSLFLRKQI